jgi:hypothetical protein
MPLRKEFLAFYRLVVFLLERIMIRFNADDILNYAKTVIDKPIFTLQTQGISSGAGQSRGDSLPAHR